MTKKKKKIIIITSIILAMFLIFSTAIFTPLFLFLPELGSQTTSKKLTNKVVIDNLVNGKWRDKLFLNAYDLQEYNFIDYNAFDNIPIILAYVELPSNISFDGSIKPINWVNVREIRVENNQNMLIMHNIFFIRINQNYYSAVTISNRNANELVFPCYKSPNDNYKKVNFAYEIVDNFYSLDNVENFKNISVFNFYEPTNDLKNDTYYAIKYFGSFINCDKLPINLNLYNCTSIRFGELIDTSLQSLTYTVVDDISQENSQKMSVHLWRIYGKQFASFSFINKTNKHVDLIMDNNRQGFITELPSFNFNFYSNIGNLILVNWVQFLPNPIYDYNSFFYRVNIKNNSELSDFIPIPFESFNAKIMINSNNNSKVMYMNAFEYLDYIWNNKNIFSNFEPTFTENILMVNVKIIENKNFNFITNNKLWFFMQMSNELYSLIKIEEFV